MFSSKILAWYQSQKRDLPWRRTSDPYHIWISEVMLQQTQVSTVIPYYERFIKAIPSIASLAQIKEADLLLLWQGLGYYSRARNLKEAAQYIQTHHQGKIPNNYDALIKIKGIGPYTAGAILAIAFNQKQIAPDGNVYRILSRYYGIKEDIRLTQTKQTLHQINEKILIEPYGDFIQSLMDFGSLVCRKLPQCEICPVKESCYAYLHDQTDKLPFISPLKPKKELHFYTFVIKDDDHFILEKEEKDLLKGLYKYPQVEAESLTYALEVLEEKGIIIDHIIGEQTYKHTFTHLIWHMQVVYCYGRAKNYIKSKTLKDYPMPTAHKKIAIKRYFDSGK